MADASTFNLILCTCPDNEVAEKIAENLVAQRLAACINILPTIQSVYRWQGNIERDEEVLLIIKARKSAFDTISESICRLHPYDLPEVIATALTAGLPGYLAWLEQETD